MPGKIKILADHVANQIAAGEVVERPASVLKELVENSLDAGAKVLEIECQGAGIELIRVTDNGEGMSRDDSLLCLERHATSKVNTLDDVERIVTYGFRGEAIPSIASVSDFKLRTCRRGDNSGTEVCVRYGKLIDVKDCGCPPGTTVEVRRLFGNTPARKKFLKTPATETAHIEKVLRITALAHPDVAIHFKGDGNTRHDWPASSPARRTLEILEKENFENLIFVDQKSPEGWHLLGWTSRQDSWHTSREHIYWFVNQRYVANRALEHAVRETYRSGTLAGRYPILVLNLRVPPHEVDVNVHPCKREVRFRHENRLRIWLVDALTNALAVADKTHLQILSSPCPEPANQKFPHAHVDEVPRLVSPSINIVTTEQKQETVTSVKPNITNAQKPQISVPPPRLIIEINQQHFGKSTLPTEKKEQNTRRKFLQITLIGRIRERYWVGETAEGMVMFDQVAAQQRILFEKLLKQQLAGSIPGQGLLQPERITLTAQQSERLKEYIPSLRKAGLIIEEFGGHDFLIEAVPPFWENGDNTSRILQLIGDLENERTGAQVRRLISEQLVAKVMARHLAGAPRLISEKEAQQLLDELLACDLPYTNPDGRPTIILFTDRDIARRFGRD
jgi:DNA mismatch repair protein MutL